jgi:hypothetical protein
MTEKADLQMVSEEHKDRKGYWENELKSLGVDPKGRDDLNDEKELEDLADNLKQVYYQNYKSAYSDKDTDESKLDYII